MASDGRVKKCTNVIVTNTSNATSETSGSLIIANASGPTISKIYTQELALPFNSVQRKISFFQDVTQLTLYINYITPTTAYYAARIGNLVALFWTSPGGDILSGLPSQFTPSTQVNRKIASQWYVDVMLTVNTDGTLAYTYDMSYDSGIAGGITYFV